MNILFRVCILDSVWDLWQWTDQAELKGEVCLLAAINHKSLGLPDYNCCISHSWLVLCCYTVYSNFNIIYTCTTVYKSCTIVWQCGLGSSCLLSFRLLSFHPLRTNLCHFAYSTYNYIITIGYLITNSRYIPSDILGLEFAGGYVLRFINQSVYT